MKSLALRRQMAGWTLWFSETNCGTPCSFDYEIELVPKGCHRGEHVASVDGATRGNNAWGVNLRWSNPDALSVEYLRAENARLLKPTVTIAGATVRVSLRNGVNDPWHLLVGCCTTLQDDHETDSMTRQTSRMGVSAH